MAHYALIDNNNVVVNVIGGCDENETIEGFDSWEQFYGQLHSLTCLRTSYNMIGGVHKTGGVPFRKNYAGIGFTYDVEKDAFIPPKPFPSWVLDNETCLWRAPKERPEGNFIWSEEALDFVILS